MKRTAWLLGFAAFSVSILGVAVFLRLQVKRVEEPKPEPDEVVAPQAVPTQPTREQRRAEMADLVRQIERLGGKCRPYGEDEFHDPHCDIELPPKTTDGDLEQLPVINFWHTLNLARTKVTDAGLSALKRQVKLLNLKLSDTKITGTGLKELATSTSLFELDLGGTNVTDDNLEDLRRFRHIESLLGLTQLTRGVVGGWADLGTPARPLG